MIYEDNLRKTHKNETKNSFLSKNIISESSLYIDPSNSSNTFNKDWMKFAQNYKEIERKETVKREKKLNDEIIKKMQDAT